MSSHTLEGKKKTQNGVKRLAFTVLSILLEVVFLIGIFKGLNEYAVFIDNLTRIFAVILVLKIYGRNETSSMKTPWIILILTFPILGVALYFMIGMNGGTRKMRMRYKRIDEKLLPLLPENKEGKRLKSGISNLKNRFMNLLICFCIITLIHMMGVCTE